MREEMRSPRSCYCINALQVVQRFGRGAQYGQLFNSSNLTYDDTRTAHLMRLFILVINMNVFCGFVSLRKANTTKRGKTVTAEETLLVTPRFRVARVSRQTRQGVLKQREVIRHPGSVVIVPVLDDHRLCLIKNFRVAVDQPLIELPAGTLEPPEAPLACATRELIEETGYRAEELTQVTSFYAAPGILDERMHLFVARKLTAGPPQREPEEEIENMIVTFDEAIELLKQGQIEDAKTMVGLLWLFSPELYTSFESSVQ